jgi:hypothetical protein
MADYTYPNGDNGGVITQRSDGLTGWAFPGCLIGESKEDCEARKKKEEQKKSETEANKGNQYTAEAVGYNKREQYKIEQARRKSTGKGAWDFTDIFK